MVKFIAVFFKMVSIHFILNIMKVDGNLILYNPDNINIFDSVSSFNLQIRLSYSKNSHLGENSFKIVIKMNVNLLKN